MPSIKKPYKFISVLLLKDEFKDYEYSEFLSKPEEVKSYVIDEEYHFQGIIFIKNSVEKKPRWSNFIETIAGREIDELWNKSSSAILFVRIDGRVFAFIFGYARFMLNMDCFVQDFGLKTALNTLDHNSLRSVDIHTLEDQPIQRKTQAVRGSNASVFGIDIFRDVLRSVTGTSRNGVNYKNITGGDAIYSFGIEMVIENIPIISKQLFKYYKLDKYKNNFSWVDNIRQVKDSEKIAHLDNKLIEALRDNDEDLVITLPEIIKWDEVDGFSFTRSKNFISPILDKAFYLEKLDLGNISVESIKNDHLFVFDVNGEESKYPVYKCIYYEVIENGFSNIIFGGKWYEVDISFIESIDSTINGIDSPEIVFPLVKHWVEIDGKTKVEREDDYNYRTSKELGFYLLDKKLIKSSKTTTPIEFCDLLTDDRQLIHVKHRKGGSACLSHLFAQASVSSQVLIGDPNFRKEVRKKLKEINSTAVSLIPLGKIKGSSYEVIFLILGQDSETLKVKMPFFSKVNLAKEYENLTQRGFKVKLAGAEMEDNINL